MTPSPGPSIWKKLALIPLGVGLSLVLLEVLLRLGGFFLVSLQESTNTDLVSDQPQCRVLCLGESTTAGQYPKFLEEALNQDPMEREFTVIDKGVPGTNSVRILAELEENLRQYKPDILVVMMGINDLHYGWSEMPYDANPETTRIGTSFLEHLRVYRLLRLLWSSFGDPDQEEDLDLETLDDYDDNMRWGTFFESRGEHDTAIRLYQRAVRLAPGSTEGYLKLGHCYLVRQLYPQAEEYLLEALERAPADDRIWVELGWCYRRQKRYAEAEKHLLKAIGINRSNGAAHLQLGVCYRKQRRYAEAAEQLEKAVELRPDDPKAYGELQRCYHDSGRVDDEQRLIREIAKLDLESDLLYGILAMNYRKHGQDATAQEFLIRASMHRLQNYNPVTRNCYREVARRATEAGIRLVAVEYPMRDVGPLKKMLDHDERFIFVDNEKVFMDALSGGKYEDYFVDNFGGLFGHCTVSGNRLLANNIAENILRNLEFATEE
jgi:tetratricopeptide (TPR) repeat protein